MQLGAKRGRSARPDRSGKTSPAPGQNTLIEFRLCAGPRKSPVHERPAATPRQRHMHRIDRAFDCQIKIVPAPRQRRDLSDRPPSLGSGCARAFGNRTTLILAPSTALPPAAENGQAGPHILVHGSPRPRSCPNIRHIAKYFVLIEARAGQPFFVGRSGHWVGAPCTFVPTAQNGGYCLCRPAVCSASACLHIARSSRHGSGGRIISPVRRKHVRDPAIGQWN